MLVRFLRRTQIAGTAYDTSSGEVDVDVDIADELVRAGNAVIVGPGDDHYVTANIDAVTGGISLVSGGDTVLSLLDGEIYSESPSDTSIFRWVAGDASNTQALSISGSFSSHPIDARRMRMSDATLQVIVAGSGTVKATVYGSADGVTNWVSMGDLLTGMVVGTGSYILRLNDSALTDWKYYKFVFTETGGAATATVKAAIYADDISAESTTATVSSVVYAIGDETAGVSIAASGAQGSIFVDSRKTRRQSGVIRVVISGAGTAKLTVYGSGSGLSDWHNLGDLITGMTAGSHSIAMSDASIAYFPYYRFIVTETGGASAVVATVFVSQKISDTYSDLPRVLVLSDSEWVTGASLGTYDDAIVDAVALLSNLGYSVDVRAVSDVTTTLFDSIGRAYEFVYIPALFDGFGWSTWTSGSGYAIGKALKGGTPIPVFVASISATSQVKVLAALGADTQEAASYRKIKWRNSYWYTYSGAYDVVQQGHMSNLSTFITKPDGTKSIAWKFQGASGWVYACAGANYGGDGSLIVHMLAEAVIDGVIDAPPKRLPVVIDLDDTPDTNNGVMTISDLDRAYSAMQRMSMPSAFGIQANHLDTVSSQMAEWVRARTADRGGLLYPIVHAGNWYWNAESKASADALFRADVAACIAKGLKVGDNAEQTDAWGYMYFNNNAFNDESMQLGSPERTMPSSPLNTLITSGYGWKVARAYTIGGAYNTNPIPATSRPSSGKTWHRGILVVGSFTGMSYADTTLDPDDGGTGTTKFSNQCSRIFAWSGAYRSPTYMHGSNLYQTGGNAPGSVFLELLADNYEAGLDSIVQFVHGSDLADI